MKCRSDRTTLRTSARHAFAPAPARPIPGSSWPLSALGLAKRLMNAAHFLAQRHQLNAPPQAVRTGIDLATQFGVEIFQRGRPLLPIWRPRSPPAHWLFPRPAWLSGRAETFWASGFLSDAWNGAVIAGQRAADGLRERRCSLISEISPDERLREILPAPVSKSPRPVSRRGLNSCDDADMQVICPTWQVFS